MVWDYPLRTDGETVVFISDTHFGRRTWTAPQLALAGRDLDSLEGLSSGFLVGGDIVHWANPSTPEDGQWSSWIAARPKNAPWVRVAGNHDLASFTSPMPSRTATQWLSAIGETNQNQSVATRGQMRMIAISPDTWTRPTWDDGITFSSSTLSWLDSQLSSNPAPTWIVAHNPLPQQYTGHMTSATADSLTNIIGSRPNVVGWLSGHRHANIRTDQNHVKAISVGGRTIAGLNAPPAGGQVTGTTLDPWGSDLHALAITYAPGSVVVRWRNLISRTWSAFNGSKSLTLSVDA